MHHRSILFLSLWLQWMVVQKLAFDMIKLLNYCRGREMATSFSPSRRRLLIILFSRCLLLGTRDYAAGWEYRGIELVVTYWIEYWTSQLHCTRPFLLFYAPRAGVGKVQQYSRYLFQLAVGRWPLIVFCQFIYSLEICIPFATLGYEPTSDQPIELHSRNENINPGWTIDNSSSCQCTCSLPLHCTALHCV